MIKVFCEEPDKWLPAMERWYSIVGIPHRSAKSQHKLTLKWEDENLTIFFTSLIEEKEMAEHGIVWRNGNAPQLAGAIARAYWMAKSEEFKEKIMEDMKK